MTTPDLVHRAEQAYLGALLARQGRVGTGTAVAGDAGPDGFAGLHPRDFTDPVHQAIYAALAGQAAPRPRALAELYERLRGLLSRLLRARARDAGAYMAGLPGLCPDPANLPAYAAMLTEASQLRAGAAPVPGPQPRRAATENVRLASAAQWLDDTGPRGRQAGPRRPAAAPGIPASRTGRTADDLAPDVARLTRALRSDAHSATHGVPGTARMTVPPQNQRPPLGAETLQEQVLADLMRHPADGRDVTSWLPDTVFTAGPNRILYQLIRVRLAGGRPVDPLIIAWDASLLSHPGSTAGIPAAVEIESLPATALRLGALDPAPGSSAILARALYAEQVCAATFGPGWPSEPGRIPAPAVPEEPSQQPQPGPYAARQAAASTAGRPGPSAAPAAARSAAAAAETARGAGTGWPAGRPAPALPRRAPALPLRPPPAGPAGPAPAQRI